MPGARRRTTSHFLGTGDGTPEPTCERSPNQQNHSIPGHSPEGSRHTEDSRHQGPLRQSRALPAASSEPLNGRFLPRWIVPPLAGAGAGMARAAQIQPVRPQLGKPGRQWQDVGVGQEESPLVSCRRSYSCRSSRASRVVAVMTVMRRWSSLTQAAIQQRGPTAQLSERIPPYEHGPGVTS